MNSLTAFVELQRAIHAFAVSLAEQKRQAVEKLTMFLELESAAAIQPSAAALEAGLMEQEQHYPCSAVLP